jgi:hypothetical protein
MDSVDKDAGDRSDLGAVFCGREDRGVARDVRGGCSVRTQIEGHRQAFIWMDAGERRGRGAARVVKYGGAKCEGFRLVYAGVWDVGAGASRSGWMSTAGWIISAGETQCDFGRRRWSWRASIALPRRSIWPAVLGEGWRISVSMWGARWLAGIWLSDKLTRRNICCGLCRKRMGSRWMRPPFAAALGVVPDAFAGRADGFSRCAACKAGG